MIVPVLLLGLALIFAYIGSHRTLSKFQLLLVTAFFGVGAVLVMSPELATRTAAVLNVGRGADLLLYFAVLCGVLVTANFYFRFKQNEQLLIQVVRKLAILSPVRPNEDEPCRKT